MGFGREIRWKIGPFRVFESLFSLNDFRRGLLSIQKRKTELQRDDIQVYVQKVQIKKHLAKQSNIFNILATVFSYVQRDSSLLS